MKKGIMGKKRYSVGEAYVFFYEAVRTFPHLVKVKTKKTISEDFMERLMLAVTEVNGCVMCSYAHTGMALESGMNADEIEMFLAGEFSSAPKEELPAIMFSQHYADNRGKPTSKAWDEIVHLYGQEKALAILSSIRIIMVGNTVGIPLGSLNMRLTGKKEQIDSRSSLPYEISMAVATLAFIPISVVHGVLAAAFHRPLIAFKPLA